MTRTNAAGVLTLLMRAAALWMVARLVMTWPGLILALNEQMDESGSLQWMTLGASAVVLLAAAAFWLFADVFARLALARPGQPPFESSLELRQWQELAFSVVGLWFAVSGATGLATNGLLFLFLRSSLSMEGYFASQWGQELAYDAVQFVLGLVLLLRARGAVGLLHRLRGYDTAPAPRVADDETSG